MVVENFKENGDTKMAKKIKAEDGKVYVEKKPFSNVYGLSCWQ